MRPHSSYPWPGRANRQMSMGPESGNPSILEDSDTVHFVQDLGFVSQCINTQQCEQRDDTTRVVGDRLHIPTFHQLPFLKDFQNVQGQDLNIHKHCLLRRTSDSLPGQITGRVSRLHEEEGAIPQCQLLISKAMQVLKRTEQLRVPGNSQTESVSHS